MPISYLRTAVKETIVYVSLEFRGLVWARDINLEAKLKSIIHQIFVKDGRKIFSKSLVTGERA